jgi:hypothetical protein
MGYALRRQDDDAGPGAGVRGRFDRWVGRIMEALHMSQAKRLREDPDIARTGALEHNWDGHWANAVPKLAQEHARWFLQRVEHKFGPAVPRPTIGAAGGGLVLVWRVPVRAGSRVTGEREIEVTFYDDGNEWSVSDRDGIEPTRSGENADEDVLLKVIDRFVVAA